MYLNNIKIPPQEIDIAARQLNCLPDMFIGQEISLCQAKYVFTLDQMDSLTKQYYTVSLFHIQQMIKKIENDLIYAGQAVFVSQIPHVDVSIIEQCQISLVDMSQLLLTSFQQLQSVRKNVRLSEYSSAVK